VLNGAASFDPWWKRREARRTAEQDGARLASHRMILISEIPAFCKQMEDKMDRLRGKVILISGGARGQGAAEARLFVAEGARVVIGDVLEPEGRLVASELGDAATFVRQDVTQEGDWKTAVNAAEKLGGLHGLVNNAGIY